MLVGVLPGLGPATATAILIPLTYDMGPAAAIIMLSGIYYGAMYGGTITSVLINTPGESASVITCLDGYPMAKQGRAGAALGSAAIGSFFGGTISILALVFIGPPLANFALKFGPPEFFALLMLGLMTVIGLMGKSLLRGLIAAMFGLSLALVGVDPVTGTDRFTFGEPYLLNGIDLVSIAMGLFGFSEILSGMENLTEGQKPPKVQGLLPHKDEVIPMTKAIGRGTLLGCLVGLIPGTNGVIPTIMSYSLEKKLAKDPSRFGKGAIEGVAGPETANNAYSGAALIPLFTLGVPSSPTIAVILGAFIMHGLTPGPSLFRENPEFVWAVIASMFIGNLILLVMNLPLANMWAKIAAVPQKILYPVILGVAVLGSFAIDNSIWSVGVMFTFGIIGYFMKKLDIPLAPIILTFVLGRLIETSLLQSLRMFNGSFVRIFERPIAMTLLSIAFLMLLFAFINSFRSKKTNYSGDTEI
jgi:putative tricarboxylic transport membrane protein